jgi:ribosomal protein S18 acetylase RimI-like enzyme
LTSYLTAGKAYSSTLERTALHTKEQWDARWAWPNAQHFIALLDTPADITSETETNIISALTLRGPFPTADLTSPVWRQLGVAGCLTYWEVNAVFTDEEYRRIGIASSIMDEVVKLVTAESGGEKTFIRLGVLEGNEEAVALYKKVGFVDKWPDDDNGGWEMVRFLGD